jgi:hypothetical protein
MWFADFNPPDHPASSAENRAIRKVSEGKKAKKAGRPFASPGRLPIFRGFESRLPDAKRSLLSSKVVSEITNFRVGVQLKFVNVFANRHA